MAGEVSLDVFPDDEQYALLDYVVPWLIDMLPEAEERYG